MGHALRPPASSFRGETVYRPIEVHAGIVPGEGVCELLPERLIAGPQRSGGP